MSDLISSPAAYIDATGIHVPTYAQILTYLQNGMRTIYGADLYLEADSQDGQMIALVAKGWHDCNSLAVAAYNGYSPATAIGAGLSASVKLIGMRRKIASYSSVVLTLGGDIAAPIVQGQCRDVNTNVIWNLPALVTIPPSGSIDVTATCSVIGAIAAVPGAINQIATPTRGWASVINSNAAVPGAAVESDTYLRQRQAISAAGAGVSTTDAMRAAIIALPGVSRIKVYENLTVTNDTVNGIPAGALGVVVEGGDVVQIANTILRTKGQRAQFVGNVTELAYDQYGFAHAISFFTVQDVAVTIIITIKAFPGYTANVGQSLINAVVLAAQDTLNGSNAIGETAFITRFYSYANIDQSIGGRTYNIRAITISAAGVSNDSAGNLLFTGAQAPLYSVANTSIVVT